MANPLKGMMGNGGNIMQSIMGGTNPQQMMMNMLQKQNPQGFQQVQQLMQSGKNPQEVFQEMTSKMSPQQMEQFNKFAQQFGIK